jgi:hypothetical protein
MSPKERIFVLVLIVFIVLHPDLWGWGRIEPMLFGWIPYHGIVVSWVAHSLCSPLYGLARRVGLAKGQFKVLSEKL